MQTSARSISETIGLIKKSISLFCDSPGSLFITWGWTLGIYYFLQFISDTIPLSFFQRDIMRFLSPGLLILALVISMITLKRRWQYRTHQTETMKFVRLLWIGTLLSMIATNLIIHQATGQVDFALQQPIFMVLIALSILGTGAVLKT